MNRTHGGPFVSVGEMSRRRGIPRHTLYQRVRAAGLTAVGTVQPYVGRPIEVFYQADLEPLCDRRDRRLKPAA